MNKLTFLDDLIACFEKLPGVGKKTATRYAYYIIEKLDIEDVNHICDVLKNTVSSVHKCPLCGMYTISDICDICSDKERDNKQLMIVKDHKDLITIEASNQYNGLYHVLGGLISAFNGIGINDLNIDNLEERIKKNNVEEVIIATSLTPEGDITSMFIERLLKDFNIQISRIGYGLPAGSDLEYADELTIKRAIDYRIKTK